MLARDPEERFDSMEAVVEAIESFCGRQKFRFDLFDTRVRIAKQETTSLLSSKVVLTSTLFIVLFCFGLFNSHAKDVIVLVRLPSLIAVNRRRMWR